MKRIVLFGLLLVGLVWGADAQPAELPDEILFTATHALPEGIEWDAVRGVFVVGSLLAGTISTVDDSGTVTELIADDDLVGTVGLHIADGLLYAPNSFSGVFFNANAQPLVSVVAYDLETGERIYWADATALREGRGFGNDLTVDIDGNVYLTNSFQPVIYKVTPEGEASILVESDLFTAGFLGLNGIEFHPDGYLLVAQSEKGTIFKISLTDPTDISEVELPEPIAIDGMALGRDGNLYAVSRLGEPETQQIVALTSSDNWTSAEISASVVTSTGAATTLALRYVSDDDLNPAVYYINSYLQNPVRRDYEIVRAVFEAE